MLQLSVCQKLKRILRYIRNSVFFEMVNIQNLPCEILVLIARFLRADEYLTFSETSKKINHGLTYLSYTNKGVNTREIVAKRLKQLFDRVKKDIFSFADISDPPQKIRDYVVEKNICLAYEYLKNPTLAETLRLVVAKPEALYMVKNPSEDIQLVALKLSNGDAIRHVENPSEKLQMAAIKAGGPEVLLHIKNPAIDVQLFAVTQKGRLGAYGISYFNPCEEAQFRSINFAPYSIQSIVSPTKNVIRYMETLGFGKNKQGMWYRNGDE